MAASLLDTLSQLVNQGFASTVGQRLGENPENVSRGMQGASTSILGGLANKTEDSSAMNRTFSLITDPQYDFRAAMESNKLADVAQTAGNIRDASSSFLADLFGDRASMVNDVIAKSSGLSVASVSSIMQMAAPFVLGFLGRRVTENGLDINSFTTMLRNERDAIMRAAPPGLASALGFQPVEREVPVQEAPRETAREAEGTYARYRQDARLTGRPRWIWPTVAALAVLALFWGARGRTHRAPMYDTSTAGGTVAPYGTPTPNVSTSTTVRLPNGTTLTVVPNGVESKLSGFIVDQEMEPNTTSWFDFDRVNFAPNSANLTPDSDEQISNVATILKAYPKVKVKIGGYTDNTGNVAANRQLSQQRAANVRSALIKDGVPADRITAEGMGAQNARPSTAAGPQAPLVSLLVVAK
jgi:Outer membrane protein and related peptidoglycan-associated (lipo)proteins